MPGAQSIEAFGHLELNVVVGDCAAGTEFHPEADLVSHAVKHFFAVGSLDDNRPN